MEMEECWQLKWCVTEVKVVDSCMALKQSYRVFNFRLLEVLDLAACVLSCKLQWNPAK